MESQELVECFPRNGIAALAMGIALALSGCSSPSTHVSPTAGVSVSADKEASTTALASVAVEPETAAWVEYVRNRSTTLGSKTDAGLVATAEGICDELSGGKMSRRLCTKLVPRCSLTPRSKISCSFSERESPDSARNTRRRAQGIARLISWAASERWRHRLRTTRTRRFFLRHVRLVRTPLKVPPAGPELYPFHERPGVRSRATGSLSLPWRSSALPLRLAT
ncbi:hypothetical protein ABIB14_002902 [Arthrobacter sp. UYEF3]